MLEIVLSILDSFIQENYLNKMKINSQFIIYLISFTVITSCSKIDVISPVNFQKQLLSGTGTYQNSKHTWQLDSTRINGVNLALTPSEKNFKKTTNFLLEIGTNGSMVYIYHLKSPIF